MKLNLLSCRFFKIMVDIKKPETEGLNFAYNSEYKTIVAGSTHGGEDEIVLNVFCELKKEIPSLKLLIAPRHPERNNDVFALIEKTGLSCSKRSETKMTPHPNPLPQGAREPIIFPSLDGRGLRGG